MSTVPPPSPSTLRAAAQPAILAFGGGVQSSALVALLGRGEYPGREPNAIWFCDPKNERPQTYDWIERVIKPYCRQMGMPFVTLERHESPMRGADLLESYRRKAAYPLRANRVCTIEWKVRVMEYEAKMWHWHTSGGVEKHLGISLDELHRARSRSDTAWFPMRYPLIERRLFRDDCIRINQETFGESPIKSGCWFCKYNRPIQWREVWEERADGRWAIAIEWEQEVVARRGMACCFVDANPRRLLTEWAKAWEQGEQLTFVIPAEGACEHGHCGI